MLIYILLFVYVYFVVKRSSACVKELYDEYFGKGDKFKDRELRKTIVFARAFSPLLWPWHLIESIVDYFLDREWYWEGHR